MHLMTLQPFPISHLFLQREQIRTLCLIFIKFSYLDCEGLNLSKQYYSLRSHFWPGKQSYYRSQVHFQSASSSLIELEAIQNYLMLMLQLEQQSYQYQGSVLRLYIIMQHQSTFSQSVLSQDFDNKLIPPPSFFTLEEPPLLADGWPDESVSSQNYPSPSGYISIVQDIDSFSGPLKLDQNQNQDEQEFNLGGLELQNKALQTTNTNFQSEMVPEGTQVVISDSFESPPHKAHSREDDSNNIHKKMITKLNEVLTSRQKRVIREKTKQLNKPENLGKLEKLEKLKKLEKLNPKKGSRYGFLCYLIIIRELLGEDSLLQVYEGYSGLPWKQFVAAASTKEKVRTYLEQLIPKYLMAFSYMIEKDIEKSVGQIYELKDFKQESYRNNGLACVHAFNKKIIRLLALADLNIKL